MQAASSEFGMYSAGRETYHLLFNRKIHCSSHRSILLDHIARRLIQIHNLIPYFLRSFLILSSHISLIILSGLFPSGFPDIVMNSFLSFPICATCAAHSPSFDHHNNKWREQVMKLPIMKCPATSCYHCLRCKYSSQQPGLKHPQCSVLRVRHQYIHTLTKQWVTL
jgi:hypothetical protein